MTATTPVLTDSKTLNEVVNCLTENLPIPTQGKCEQKNISHLFTLKQMLEFLRQAVDRNYGVVCELYLPSG
ncbi:MAG: hypothetical protein V7K41_20070 [Nostoc sp.]